MCVETAFPSEELNAHVKRFSRALEALAHFQFQFTSNYSDFALNKKQLRESHLFLLSSFKSFFAFFW